MKEKVPLLILGAGPFGLSLAAYLKRKNVEYLQLGHSMDYWKDHMPRKMVLRSASDWHLDPFDEDTILKYLEMQSLTPKDVEPLTLEFYLGYAKWFQDRQGLIPRPTWVRRLSRVEDVFVAETDEGEIETPKVVLAVGLRYFKNIPKEYESLIPHNRFQHTAEQADFSALRGKKVLIIGGRQSAFEWAALIHEQGAREVHLTYRHDTPAFELSEWEWVNPLLRDMVDQPGWFRNLQQEEKDRISQHMWTEGRLKLEPWLVKRITQDSIHTHPHTHVKDCKEMPSGELQITLSDETILLIDYVIFATGYKVDITRLSMLTESNLVQEVKTRNGFPILDEGFQSSVPNLYFTGFPAAQDFGPFFGFTAAVRTSALVLGRQFA